VLFNKGKEKTQTVLVVELSDIQETGCKHGVEKKYTTEVWVNSIHERLFVVKKVWCKFLKDLICYQIEPKI
jgi:ribosomal protein S10